MTASSQSEPRPLRVLHVIPSMSERYGGPTKAMLALERELTSAGIVTTVATTDDDGPGRRLDPPLPQSAEGGERIYHRKWTDFYTVAPSLLPWLWRNVRRYDVVHIHALFTFSSVAAAAISRLRGIPYIVLAHGMLARYGMTERRPLLKRLSLAMLEGPMLRNAAAVQFTSEMEAEEARDLGIPMREIVIPLGVEPALPNQRAAHVQTPREAGAPATLLFLSRLDPKKNLEGLLKAMAGLADRYPHLRLEIAGDGTAAYKADLRALTTSLGLKDRVTWLGHIEGEAKAAAFGRADLYVLPSHSESFGIAAVEAMLAGCPCIIGEDVAVARDLAAADAAAIVAPQPSHIAAAIAQLLDDDARRTDLGARARHYAEQNYSTEAMARRFISLYEGVVGKSAVSRCADAVTSEQSLATEANRTVAAVPAQGSGVAASASPQREPQVADSSCSRSAPDALPTANALPVPVPRPPLRTIVIEPRSGWRSLDLGELWAHRELFRVLAERDIRVRYKQTVLGSAWAILQPVLTMVIFSIVFGSFAKIPSDGLPYPIFTYAALLPWLFFSNSVTNASQSLVSSSHLVSKVYFPRLIIPLASIGAAVVDFAIASSVLLLMMIYYGVGLSWNLLLAPLLAAGVMLAALGVGTLLSALTTSYRDFRYVVPFLVQTWMFATPVAYPISIVPESWRWLFYLNPMTGLIDGFRASFLGQPFNMPALLTSVVMVIAIFIISLAYFKRVERRFADII